MLKYVNVVFRGIFAVCPLNREGGSLDLSTWYMDIPKNREHLMGFVQLLFKDREIRRNISETAAAAKAVSSNLLEIQDSKFESEDTLTIVSVCTPGLGHTGDFCLAII